MAEKSVRRDSTRHHRCDEAFLELLELDFGIPQFFLRAAFMGSPPAPMKQSIKVCQWAVRAAAGDPEEAGKALRAWARKRGVGTYDPRLNDPEPPTFGGHEARGV
jgi:hypothetical protein